MTAAVIADANGETWLVVHCHACGTAFATSSSHEEDVSRRIAEDPPLLRCDHFRVFAVRAVVTKVAV